MKNELNPFLKATYGLVWESGDPLVKEFPVTIINDQKLEDNETVLLKLEEPFLLRRWAMTTNGFDALMLELISNSADEVDSYWVQNQAIAPGGGDGGGDGGDGGGGGDTDGDGLSDDDEANLGTDPNNADSDGDTFSDGDEVARGTDPLDGANFPEDGGGDGGDGGDGGEEEEEVPLPEPIATALLGKDYLHVLTIVDDDLGVVSLTSPSKKTNEDGPTEGTMVFEIEVPSGTPKWKFKGDPGMITPGDRAERPYLSRLRLRQSICRAPGWFAAVVIQGGWFHRCCPSDRHGRHGVRWPVRPSSIHWMRLAH